MKCGGKVLLESTGVAAVHINEVTFAAAARIAVILGLSRVNRTGVAAACTVAHHYQSSRWTVVPGLDPLQLLPNLDYPHLSASAQHLHCVTWWTVRKKVTNR
jgi:hypothetical protein